MHRRPDLLIKETFRPAPTNQILNRVSAAPQAFEPKAEDARRPSWTAASFYAVSGQGVSGKKRPRLSYSGSLTRGRCSTAQPAMRQETHWFTAIIAGSPSTSSPCTESRRVPRYWNVRFAPASCTLAARTICAQAAAAGTSRPEGTARPVQPRYAHGRPRLTPDAHPRAKRLLQPSIFTIKDISAIQPRPEGLIMGENFDPCSILEINWTCHG